MSIKSTRKVKFFLLHETINKNFGQTPSSNFALRLLKGPGSEGTCIPFLYFLLPKLGTLIRSRYYVRLCEPAP